MFLGNLSPCVQQGPAAPFFCRPETIQLIQSDEIAKGNVLATARLAGILAAKKTGELIPLAHPLSLAHAEVSFEMPASRDRILIFASARIASQTGVEMEALTAVSMAALTIYDMCKAVDPEMRIGDVAVDFQRENSRRVSEFFIYIVR